MAAQSGLALGTLTAWLGACESAPTDNEPATASNLVCPGSSPGKLDLFWGDLHVHTKYSMDALAFGAPVDPAQAYQFARGGEVPISGGRTAQIRRPLDFAAVTDHAESFGVLHLCAQPEHQGDDFCQELVRGSQPENAYFTFTDIFARSLEDTVPKPFPYCDKPGVDCDGAARELWAQIVQQANDANDACSFTALVGNEWSATPNGLHWHRNLIYRGDSVPERAINYFDEPSVEELWSALDQTCRAEDGCEVLAIPHNPNMGEGGTFDVGSESEGVSRLRAEYERLLEIHQHKGSSECLYGWGEETPDDCDYEIYLPNPLRTRIAEEGAQTITEADWQRARRGYARTLLGEGDGP